MTTLRWEFRAATGEEAVVSNDAGKEVLRVRSDGCFVRNWRDEREGTPGYRHLATKNQSLAVKVLQHLKAGKPIDAKLLTLQEKPEDFEAAVEGWCA